MLTSCNLSCDMWWVIRGLEAENRWSDLKGSSLKSSIMNDDGSPVISTSWECFPCTNGELQMNFPKAVYIVVWSEDLGIDVEGLRYDFQRGDQSSACLKSHITNNFPDQANKVVFVHKVRNGHCSLVPNLIIRISLCASPKHAKMMTSHMQVSVFFSFF